MVEGMDNRRYLLDTNVIVEMLRGNDIVRKRIVKESFNNCCVSEISIAELFYGAAKSGREQNFIDIKNVMRRFEVIPILPCLKTYGDLKSNLERKGNRVDDFDLLIGATAIFNGFTMVTANTRHFERMVGIQLDNWQ